MLATILINSDEPVLAARHLVRAGATKPIEALGKSLPFNFIDILDDLDAPNYWTVGTNYCLLASQADLVPDDLVGTLAERLVAELTAAEAGSRPDLRAFGTSRYNNAIKVLAGIADRLGAMHADAVLSHFEEQPPLEEHHYRYHDEDEAVAVAKIAITHAPFADPAIQHLVALLGRSQGAREKITLDAIERNRSLANDPLTELANNGNPWAREMLSFTGSKDLGDSVATDALARLTTPLEHTNGVYSVGTNAVGDSLLILHLPPDAIDTAVAELLVRADDPHIGSSDRGAYLIAAANLSSEVSESKRHEYFAAAIRLATTPTPSELDKLNERFTHKLGGHRMNGTLSGSRGQALFLAASLAVDADQYERVRRLAYLGLGEQSDYWPTQALQRLGDAVRDDLAFLASQGWAIRSLAASLWVEYAEPTPLGSRLAVDPDVRVRRAMAEALAQQPESSHPTIRELLAIDPAYSVRAALASPAKGDPEV